MIPLRDKLVGHWPPSGRCNQSSTDRRELDSNDASDARIFRPKPIYRRCILRANRRRWKTAVRPSSGIEPNEDAQY